ncbi:Putative glycosyltransferase EpsE [Aeoliella mucimassa]|uniref:Glycosyltransferase EpsE n=2 Tax=Aeoliella mucimassa TaxID=2527972 RepID=A0A518AN09_9BACT|nr:Putative glycosyltransferase EpsE [Aeoliella mucimassa]
MTVFNGMPYLPASVESVLNQSFDDFEFIIVNDGSTDGTADYLASLADPRIHVIYQENGGTAVAANHGLTCCTGQYTARMDSDDVSLPHRLATQVAYLDAHPEVGLVGAQMAPLGQAGVGASLNLPTTHDEVFAAMMDGRHGLAHACILMRTDLLKQIGGYWKVPLQDAWDMMIRMGEVSKLANIDEVLHHYRVHIGSLNGKGMRRMRFSIDYARHLATLRQQGLPLITHEEYAQQRAAIGWMAKMRESIDLHSRCQYRVAIAELYGNRRVRGYLRMAWAAALAPRLTTARIVRMIEERFVKIPHRNKSKRSASTGNPPIARSA